MRDDVADALGAVPRSAIERLGTGLAARAETEGLLDVAYCVLDSPLGPLLVAATERGVVRLAYAQEGHDAVLGHLAREISPRVLESPRRLDAVAHELDEYFRAGRRSFGVALDLGLVRGAFRRSVVEHLALIPFGDTRSYAAVAGEVGRPGASRAVGSACANNPLPLLLPCHRVVRTDGSIGHYLGGADAKRRLLELERERMART